MLGNKVSARVSREEREYLLLSNLERSIDEVGREITGTIDDGSNVTNRSSLLSRVLDVSGDVGRFSGSSLCLISSLTSELLCFFASVLGGFLDFSSSGGDVAAIRKNVIVRNTAEKAERRQTGGGGRKGCY